MENIIPTVTVYHTFDKRGKVTVDITAGQLVELIELLESCENTTEFRWNLLGQLRNAVQSTYRL